MVIRVFPMRLCDFLWGHDHYWCRGIPLRGADITSTCRVITISALDPNHSEPKFQAFQAI